MYPLPAALRNPQPTQAASTVHVQRRRASTCMTTGAAVGTKISHNYRSAHFLVWLLPMLWQDEAQPAQAHSNLHFKRCPHMPGATSTAAAVDMSASLYYEIRKYDQSTHKAHAEVPQNPVVNCLFPKLYPLSVRNKAKKGQKQKQKNQKASSVKQWPHLDRQRPHGLGGSWPCGCRI